eukprot:1143942-Pelagomonas_calceolata.AAC.6
MHAGAPAGASAQMHEEDWCLAFAELPSTSHAATACAMHIDHLPLRSCHWQVMEGDGNISVPMIIDRNIFVRQRLAMRKRSA